MSQIEQLVRGFERAHVPLVLSPRPFVRGVADESIVQMDVARAPDSEPREHILLWPGRNAELRVSGHDGRLRQLVLRVREARRKFHEERWDRTVKRLVTVERWTDPAPRRFLVGMDESHLFVAQLTTRATTVAEAHRGLRPPELKERPEAARQGEWFFVPASEEELREARRCSRRFRARNAPIGRNLARRGRPHWADHVVRIPGEPGRWIELVRGSIRHPDHATVSFPEWMRVFVNTENRGVGATWVD
ncbi:MAG TPA: hypothetical protein VFF73_12215 [Planctomycetota bacterium]|nr:hypothetical protein [Planctomycetota bacterium]